MRRKDTLQRFNGNSIFMKFAALEYSIDNAASIGGSLLGCLPALSVFVCQKQTLSGEGGTSRATMQARAAIAYCERLLRRGHASQRRPATRRPSAQDWWQLWRSRMLVGGVVIVGALETITAPPNRARCNGTYELSGSRMIDEWCCSFLSQDVWSSYDIGGATIQASAPGASLLNRTVVVQGNVDLGNVDQDDVSRRLCWYVSFNDLFPQSREMSAAAIADKAVDLMHEALAWQAITESYADSECQHTAPDKVFPFFRHFSGKNSSRDRKCSQTAIPEKPEVTFTWVDAPKSKGLALVCIAPKEKLAVIAVRGSVNIRNILQALKVWPQTPSKSEGGVGVSLHSGFAEVADEMMVKIEPLLEKGMTIHLTGETVKLLYLLGSWQRQMSPKRACADGQRHPLTCLCCAWFRAQSRRSGQHDPGASTQGKGLRHFADCCLRDAARDLGRRRGAAAARHPATSRRTSARPHRPLSGAHPRAGVAGRR